MSGPPTRILLQTTIPPTEDDWSIARFSQLAKLLSETTDDEGEPLYDVTARDRGPLGMPDPILSVLDATEFDQLWLFAVDTGDGLTIEDCDAISSFRRSGGGMMVTRDHQDLGSSICTLAGVGAAHFFHTHNIPEDGGCVRDDPYTLDISWPNFHSGANGDYQRVHFVGPIHAVMRDPGSPHGALRYLPAHPHEGGVVAPRDADARVIATGRSLATGQTFNIAVAFEAGADGGRAIAQSTFHHFADYNWDTRFGSPSFVSEAPGDGLLANAQAIRDTHRYALNLAAWLGARS